MKIVIMAIGIIIIVNKTIPVIPMKNIVDYNWFHKCI